MRFGLHIPDSIHETQEDITHYQDKKDSGDRLCDDIDVGLKQL